MAVLVPHLVDSLEPVEKIDAMVWTNPEVVVNGMAETKIWDGENAVWLLVGGPGPIGPAGPTGPEGPAGGLVDHAADHAVGGGDPLLAAGLPLHAAQHGTAGTDDLGDVFAGFIEFGGDHNNSSSVITASFVTYATTTFTKPASWVTYKMMAWGHAVFNDRGAAEAHLGIGGQYGDISSTWNNITSVSSIETISHGVPVRHQRTGLTGNSVVEIQVREQAGSDESHLFSVVNFIAIRTS